MAAHPHPVFRPLATAVLIAGTTLGATWGIAQSQFPAAGSAAKKHDPLIASGQQIFRYDTFGDEQLWTDQLRMHEVVESSVDPITALAVGLKVDADALPPGILDTAD